MTSPPSSDTDDLPRYIIHIVVWVRVLVSGGIVYGLTYLLAPHLGYPPVPHPVTSVPPGLILGWIGLFAALAFVTIGVLYLPLVALSWTVAALISPTVRSQLKTEWDATAPDSP